MSSAILLSSVLIHLEFIPSGEPIRREQKKRASLWPIIDFLHVLVVQLKADALSVTLRRTGCVIGGGSHHDNMEHRAVIYDDGDKLEDVN